MNHLEEKILELIEKLYNKKYIGGLKVTKLISGYSLVLYLGNYDKKTIQISADLESEEDFLDYIKKELASRRLASVEFFKGILIEDDERLTYKEDQSCNKRACLR